MAMTDRACRLLRQAPHRPRPLGRAVECCAVTLSLCLASLAGCGGGSPPAAGGQVVVASGHGKPASGIESDAPARPAAANDSARNNARAPEAPALGLTVVGMQLRFSWHASSAAADYKLFANADGTSGFTRVPLDLPAGKGSATLDLATHQPQWDRARYLLEACNDAGCTASNAVTTLGLVPPAAYLAQTARGRFNRGVAAPSAVEVTTAGASARYRTLPSAPLPAALPPLAGPRWPGATPDAERACARCLPR
jgi:hypothetical protein